MRISEWAQGIALASALSVLCACRVANGGAVRYDLSQYNPLSVGDKWTYDSGSGSVTVAVTGEVRVGDIRYRDGRTTDSGRMELSSFVPGRAS